MGPRGLGIRASAFRHHRATRTCYDAGMSTPPFDLAAHLVSVCQPQIGMIRAHPWLHEAAKDQLEDVQIGSWATQDLLWGNYIGPAYELGFTDPTPSTTIAVDFLKVNNVPEVAFLEATSKNVRNAPNADIIWPGFLGYGTWGSQVAQQETVAAGAPHPLALTVVWVAEYAYNQAWHVVKAGHPKNASIEFGVNDWAASGFDEFVVSLSAGLNEAAASSAIPVATFEATARQGFLWESQAWTASFECIGWNLPHHKGDVTGA
jgi:hypothetical protein